MKSKNIYLLVLIVFGLTGTACSQKKLSEQDRRRQQELLTADKIRADLVLVAGSYEGNIKAESKLDQPIRLTLLVKDVPVNVEGSAEPVLTPKLVGNLRFIYDESGNEYIDAPIQAAEYFRGRETLNIVVTHSTFGELTINYSVQGPVLTGTWSAPTMGANGVSTVSRK